MTETGDLAERLLAHLRRESGDASLSYRSPPERMSGGNETLIYAFELETGSERFAGPLILRAIPVNYDPRRALWEAAVQESVVEQGYPAPRPRTACADPEVIGHAFLIMDRIGGQPLGIAGDASPLLQESALRRGWFLLRTLAKLLPLIDALAENLGEQMGRLHSLDPAPLRLKAQEAGLPESLIATQHRLDEIGERLGASEMAGLRPALAWFRDHLPPEPERTAICHGDFLNVNVFGDEAGAITGVIDWSFARVGDPAYDVGSTSAITSVLSGMLPAPARPVIDRLLARSERRFRERYQSMLPIDEERVSYWLGLRCMFELGGIASARVYEPTETRRSMPGAGKNVWDAPGLIGRLTRGVREVSGITPELPPPRPSS